MKDLKGLTAIITGASSGIGAAVAKELDRAGMRLVLTARREEALKDLAGAMNEAVVVAGDIADEALPQELIDTAMERFGSVDVVFNNAGIMHVGPIEKIDVDAVAKMVRVNVEAAYRLALLSLRQMLAQGKGHLINTSSTLGTKVRPNAGAYAGTKFAIEALSEDLRMQVAGKGVRVGVIEPGLTRTELQSHFPTHPAKALNIARMAEPEDIARAVRFMLEQPEHVTIPRLMLQPAEQPT